MSSSRKSCVNHPDVFCYICGEYTLKENRKTITDFVKRAYNGYFGVKLGDQDKTWAPHFVCKTCTEHLRQWTTGRRRSLKFGVPMVWREPKNHFDDCYFCVVNINGINRNNRSKWTYPNLESSRRPVSHSDEIPIPTYHQLPELSDDESNHSDTPCEQDLGKDSDYEEELNSPQRFDQKELSDLVRDLSLSKEAAELLASRLNEKNLLEQGTKITFYRSREKDLLSFFLKKINLCSAKMLKDFLRKWVLLRIFQETGAFLLTVPNAV